MDNFNSIFSSIIDALIERYPDVSEETVEQIVEDSAFTYLTLRNVPHGEVDDYEFNSLEKSWVKKCATEILERGDFYGVQAYAENGYSVSYFADTISSFLKRQVFPRINTLSESNFH